ncbi:MAG TPA: substrate-binding domain-containing protein [Desulfomonilaceae bacterium]|nr:substrate-binding domain-containing protein [Desulfomonilaceae bacterium]
MKKIFGTTLGVTFAFIVLVLVLLANAQEGGKKILRVNGAGMASDQVNLWAQRFMETNADVSIMVIGSSAGKGFQSLVDGTAETAMMSRDITADERSKANDKGLQLIEKPIGQAAVALITSARNPVNELTLGQVKKLYAGEYDNWKQVGGPDEPVRCISRRVPESGGAVFFQSKVLDKEPFGPKTMFTETWEAIIKVCSTAQDLPIGIIPHTRNLSGVKVLGIKRDDASAAVTPTEDNVKSELYPIILSFKFAWNDKSKDPTIQKFADFCESRGRSK